MDKRFEDDWLQHCFEQLRAADDRARPQVRAIIGGQSQRAAARGARPPRVPRWSAACAGLLTAVALGWWWLGAAADSRLTPAQDSVELSFAELDAALGHHAELMQTAQWSPPTDTLLCELTIGRNEDLTNLLP